MFDHDHPTDPEPQKVTPLRGSISTSNGKNGAGLQAGFLEKRRSVEQTHSPLKVFTKKNDGILSI